MSSFISFQLLNLTIDPSKMTTRSPGEEGGGDNTPIFIGGPHPLPNPDLDPFISFHNHEGGLGDLPVVTRSIGENGGDDYGITSKSIGEEGGNNDGQYTTLSLGEEGGGFNPEPISLPEQEGGGDDMPTYTTMSLGEEGGGFNPEPISLPEQEGGGDDMPTYTTMSLGEEGGGDIFPPPLPQPGFPFQKIISDIFVDRLYERFNRNFFATENI